jgi:hypothetical protein
MLKSFQVDTLLDDWNLGESVPELSDNTELELIQPSMADGPWIAGGMARKLYTNSSEPTSDYDVWCKSDEQFEDLATRIRATSQFGEYYTENAITFTAYTDHTRKIQLIKRICDSPEDIISEFDFTVCQVVTDTAEFVLGPTTARDLNTKTLKLAHHPLKKNCIPRIVKYVTYGFKPDDTLLGLITTNKGDIEWHSQLTY